MKVKKCEYVPQLVLAEIHDLCTFRERTRQSNTQNFEKKKTQPGKFSFHECYFTQITVACTCSVPPRNSATAATGFPNKVSKFFS